EECRRSSRHGGAGVSACDEEARLKRALYLTTVIRAKNISSIASAGRAAPMDFNLIESTGIACVLFEKSVRNSYRALGLGTQPLSPPAGPSTAQGQSKPDPAHHHYIRLSHDRHRLPTFRHN